MMQSFTIANAVEMDKKRNMEQCQCRGVPNAQDLRIYFRFQQLAINRAVTQNYYKGRMAKLYIID